MIFLVTQIKNTLCDLFLFSKGFVFNRAVLSSSPLSIVALPILAVSMFTFNSHAEVYRWVDSNGEVQFTDRPSPESLKGAKENRAQKVEVIESNPASQESLQSGVMDFSRYYRATKNNTPSSAKKSSHQAEMKKQVNIDKNDLNAQQQAEKEKAQAWFTEHCVYYAKSTGVRYSPYDIGAKEYRKQKGMKLTKAEKERDKKIDKLVENRIKQNQNYAQYATSQNGVTKASSNIMGRKDEEKLKNAYKLKMVKRTRVKSFNLACEDDNGNVHPELEKYQAYLNYPAVINPEAMDQFIADNPDIRVE